MDYSAPAFELTLSNQSLTTKIAPRLINISLTECSNNASDQLDISVSDTDNVLVLPPCGAQVRLYLGWQNDPLHPSLIDKGSFTVDEIEHTGSPDQLIIRARSTNFIDRFKEIQDISYHDTTLGTIIDIIAFRNTINSGVAEELRDIVIAHLDQTKESDAAFLRRLGQIYDAVATIKNNTLLFIPTQLSRSQSGKPLSIRPLWKLSRARQRQGAWSTATFVY